MAPGEERLLVAQLLSGTLIRRSWTIGALIAVPFLAFIAQYVAPTGFTSSAGDVRPIVTVVATAIILALGLQLLWWLVHLQIRPIEDTVPVGERSRLGQFVEKAYGKKYSEVLGASVCALACTTLVVLSSWPRVDVGFAIAIAELTFFAPNSLYWALRLAQFTRALAAFRHRLGDPDPRDNFAIQRLGAVVALAIGLVGWEMILSGLTTRFIAEALVAEVPFGWRAIVLLGGMGLVLTIMALVALNFFAALVALRVRVWSERRMITELKQDELDLLRSIPMSRNTRRNRSKKLRKELARLRAPRRDVKDAWLQFGFLLLGLPIATIANLVSDNWHKLTS